MRRYGTDPKRAKALRRGGLRLDAPPTSAHRRKDRPSRQRQRQDLRRNLDAFREDARRLRGDPQP